ncbi:MAG: two-component system response regulator FixJ, partial [Pirellulaceae bacterium]
FQPSELWSHIERALESRMSSLNIRHVRALLKTRAQKLSDNERAVLQQMVAGKANKVIASELDMGLRTVELRRAKVLQKMQADSVAELVRMAVILGIDSGRKLA